MLAMKGVYPMTEIESLQDKDVIADIAQLKVPGLDAERHLVTLRVPVNGTAVEHR
jgi:16S rRNA (guanine527-N7)-methyltransferase